MAQLSDDAQSSLNPNGFAAAQGGVMKRMAQRFERFVELGKASSQGLRVTNLPTETARLVLSMQISYNS